MTRPDYPSSAKVEQYDDYHGKSIHDPYRWLEDPDAPETREWIAAQNALTLAHLERLPAREPFRRRLSELWNHPRVGATWARRVRYFQFRNTGLQNQNVLYVMDSLDGNADVLLDPNTLSDDGTVALNSWHVSRDGRFLAYAISASGSDWQTWRVRDVTSRQDLPDTVEWSKFSSATWLRDGSGFLYTRYDAPAPGAAYTAANWNQKVFFHRLGRSQADDSLVLARPDHPDWRFATAVSDEGRYLVATVRNSTARRNRVLYKDLSANVHWRDLIDSFEAGFEFVGNDGTRFYFWTNYQAPCGKLVAIDVQTPEPRLWETLIPEEADPLDAVQMVHDTFVCLYQHEAQHQLRLVDKTGRGGNTIELPAAGSVLDIQGERDDAELFYSFHSFLFPPAVFRYDFGTEQNTVVAQTRVNFDFGPYEVEQQFATSRDGTRVPMYIVAPKDRARDGRNPTVLYGYG